jgi:RimJ/RimL family protein N-acetyltransferase
MILEGLETERLIFNALTLDDVDSLIPFFLNEKAMEFLSPVTLPVEKHVEKWVSRQLERYDNDGYGLTKLISKETGELVGLCGLLYQVVDDEEELEIGYRLMPGHWGLGYATEAAVACRDYALALNAAPSIISIIHVDNTASQRVAARNGMIPGKQTKFHGHPVVIYRIYRTDWLELMNQD